MIEGHCLCGAVTITTDSLSREMSACFCEMCRRWSGSAMMGIEAPADSVTVSGPVKIYRSSSFSQRAWCETCGSNLWLKDDDGPYELMPGLFQNAGGARLVRTVYDDCRPDGWDFAGDHKRVSRAEYEKTHMFVPEGDLR